MWYLRGTMVSGLLLGVAVGLTGCYTPPARWAPDAGEQRTIELTSSTSGVLSRLSAGFQRCSVEYGVPDCTPLDEEGRAACDVYYPLFPFGGARHPAGIGRVLLTPAAGGTMTTMIVGRGPAPHYFDGWTQMMQGRAAALCP